MKTLTLRTSIYLFLAACLIPSSLFSEAKESLEERRKRLERKYLSKKVEAVESNEFDPLLNEREQELLEESSGFKKKAALLTREAEQIGAGFMPPPARPRPPVPQKKGLFDLQVEVKDAFAADRERERKMDPFNLNRSNSDLPSLTEQENNGWFNRRNENRSTGGFNRGNSASDNRSSGSSFWGNDNTPYRSSFSEQPRESRINTFGSGNTSSGSSQFGARSTTTSPSFRGTPTYIPFSQRIRENSSSAQGSLAPSTHSAYSTATGTRGQRSTFGNHRATQQTDQGFNRRSTTSGTTWKKSYERNSSRPEELDRMLGN
jgi:hypothetical protein